MLCITKLVLASMRSTMMRSMHGGFIYHNLHPEAMRSSLCDDLGFIFRNQEPFPKVCCHVGVDRHIVYGGRDV